MSNRVGQKTEFGPGKTALYYNNKGLFSDPFLEDRLPNLEKYYNNPSTRFLNEYWNIDESENSNKFNQAFQEIMNLWTNKFDQSLSKYCKIERQIEYHWTDKIFEILGWSLEKGESSKKNGITNFPDYTLFASLEDWKKSKSLPDATKFKKATAVADAKDYGISLDGKGFSNKNPSFQIVNYLKQTDKNWGILTDGRYWRIYSLRSDSKHTTFYEIDLEKILASGDSQRFKYFYNFFRVEAFVVDAKLSDRSFLDFVFEDGKFYAQIVDKNLNERVYKVVSSICQGFLCNYQDPTEKELKEIYTNSMYYLFKLMFILNCESKGLLEVNKQDDYYEFSLRKKCLELKEQLEAGKNWSSQPRTYNFINDLFNLLKTGDQRIGVHGFGNEPFEIGNAEFYRSKKIGDNYLNIAVLDLSCDQDSEGNLQFIDYKILSPDHIGSLFEGLLEFSLVKDKKNISLLNTKGERKASGSYYTHDYIVNYMVSSALEDVISNKNTQEILKIKVCDPAMGSGHFLLGVLKFVEEKVQEIQDKHPDDKKNLKFDEIRKQILQNCIFGVDKNALAVELSKFSLWLYSADKGEFLEPLSDQFKLGNSLIAGDFLEITGKNIPNEIISFDWKSEFKAVFEAGGFDLVIGNPPFIETKLISELEKPYIYEKYNSMFEKSNYYVCFYELALSLINQQASSKIAFVTPPDWLDRQKSYKPFKSFLIEHFRLDNICKLDKNAFPVPTNVYFLSRKTGKKFSILASELFKGDKSGDWIVKSKKDSRSMQKIFSLDDTFAGNLPHLLVNAPTVRLTTDFRVELGISLVKEKFKKSFNGTGRFLSGGVKEKIILGNSDVTTGFNYEEAVKLKGVSDRLRTADLFTGEKLIIKRRPFTVLFEERTLYCKSNCMILKNKKNYRMDLRSLAIILNSSWFKSFMTEKARHAQAGKDFFELLEVPFVSFENSEVIMTELSKHNYKVQVELIDRLLSGEPIVQNKVS